LATQRFLQKLAHVNLHGLEAMLRTLTLFMNVFGRRGVVKYSFRIGECLTDVIYRC